MKVLGVFLLHRIVLLSSRWLLALRIVLCTAVALPQVAFAAWIVPPRQEATVLRLAEPWHIDTEVAPGITWRSVAIREDTLAFGLARPGAETAVVAVRWDRENHTAPNIAVAIDAPAPVDPVLRQAAETLQARLAERAPSVLSKQVLQWVEPVAHAPSEPDLIEFHRFTFRECWESLALPQSAAAVGLILLALGLALRRKVPRRYIVFGVALIVGLGLWSWQYVGPQVSHELPQQLHVFTRREFFVLSLLLAVVVAGWLSLAFQGVQALRGPTSPPAHTQIALLALAVGLVAVGVRYGLTTLNILSDANAGYLRLLVYFTGYGLDHLLLSYLLPGQTEGDMVAHMEGIRLLSSLAPPLLVILAYRLGMGVVGAGIAGLALACWPIHAALSASDTLQGPVLALAAVAAIQVCAPTPRDRFLGFLTLGLAIWARPESALTLAPFAAVGVLAWRRGGARWSVVLGACAFAAIVVIRGQALYAQGMFDRANLHVPPATSHLYEIGFADQAALPWFVQFGVLLAPLAWRKTRETQLLAWFGAAVALGLAFAHTKRFMQLEFFRYGAPSALWLCLLAAMGWNGAAKRLPLRWQRGAPWLIALGMLVLVWGKREYLDRLYDVNAEQPLLKQALTGLPAGATIVVPGEQTAGGLDVCHRYWAILSRFATTGQSNRLRTVCAYDVLNGKLPPVVGTVYWFHGVDCFSRVANEAADNFGNCAEVERAFDRRRVWQSGIDLWYRRAVIRGSDPGPPWHDSKALIFLDELRPKQPMANAR